MVSPLSSVMTWRLRRKLCCPLCQEITCKVDTLETNTRQIFWLGLRIWNSSVNYAWCIILFVCLRFTKLLPAIPVRDSCQQTLSHIFPIFGPVFILSLSPLHYYPGYCDHKMQTALPLSSSPSVMCPANREKSIFHFLPFISDYSLFDLVVSNISEKLILVEKSPEDGHKTLLCKTSKFRKVLTGGQINSFQGIYLKILKPKCN